MTVVKRRKRPTAEQTHICEVFDTGADMVIEAGAGTGKTTTLSMLGNLLTRKERGLYLAFNRAIADDAAGKFPARVKTSTAHALAYGEVGWQYRDRMNQPRVPFQITAKVLGIYNPITINGRYLTRAALNRMALDTVRRFCRSDDTHIQNHHVPFVHALDPAESTDRLGRTMLCNLLVPAATRAWSDIQRLDGVLRFEHDHYLKMWADTHPQLPYDVIMFDEAQDADPLLQRIVKDQGDAQRVIVGDSAQAIYDWRGAVNAIKSFSGYEQLTLSESWRFGPQIAELANVFLDRLDAPIRLTGRGRTGVVERFSGIADVVLCRTNKTTITVVMDALQNDMKVHLVGGTTDLIAFCQAAMELQQGKRVSYPELAAFANWVEVRDYVEHDPAGGDLKTIVGIVDDVGAQAVIDALHRCVPEEYADIVVSTAHKAKGREWGTVRISHDFPNPNDPEIGDGSLRLSYVSVTRAKSRLDPGPLAMGEGGL